MRSPSRPIFTRGVLFLAFPMFGSLLALLFRPSEVDWRTLLPPEPSPEFRTTLALPDGRALRFIGVPDVTGRPAYYLSETEVPAELVADFVSHPPGLEDARAFCAALSRQTGRRIRLPTRSEWRLAARGGVSNAEFPWGFGPPVPPRGTRFDLDKPPASPGPAFGYGYRDLAGGVWEWTSEGHLLGGAWSERNPETLRIDFIWRPPPGYAGEDAGIRLLLEPEPPPRR